MRQFRPTRFRRAASVGISTTLAVSVASGLTVPARAATRTDVLQAASSYARQHGYHVGIAVLDTRTGVLRGAGDWTGIYASESLIKVFIATRLLVQHRMSGATESRAWKMITQSDDAIATSFYSSVGGDGLVNWIKARYRVPDLGYPPSRPGWWGNTHLRPSGLVKLYAKIKRDRTVAPWLLNAMHHARPYGSDGTWQYFGIPSATKGFAVKQGWGNDYEVGSSADFNTTGFINHDRYAVAILARGPSSSYGSAISNLLTQVARRLLPNGVFPEGVPTITAMSLHSGSTLGGDRVVVHGTAFTNVTGVRFGPNYAARSYRVVSPSEIVAVSPKHIRNDCSVRIETTHGITAPNGPADFRFEYPPTVTGLGSHLGPSRGGGTVLINGRTFTRVNQVTIGGTATTYRVLSGTQLRAAVPKHAAGVVDVRVRTAYGRSPVSDGDKYRYVDPPTITGVAPTSGPAGTTVTIDGSGYVGTVTVTFGNTPADKVTVTNSGKLTAGSPAHGSGTVAITVKTPYGSVTKSSAYTYP